MDFDPVKKVRDERKARVAKNEKQRAGNIARAAPRERDVRKKEIETTLATTRISTASMGKFDKKLEGEKKMRGVKRKVRLDFTFQLAHLIGSNRLLYSFSSSPQKAMRLKILWPSCPAWTARRDAREKRQGKRLMVKF